jgi:hypothetical protein
MNDITVLLLVIKFECYLNWEISACISFESIIDDFKSLGTRKASL